MRTQYTLAAISALAVVAGGVIPVSSLLNTWYVILPYLFTLLGEVSVVCRLPFGAIAAYLNHYSSPRKEWNVGLTIGWQLFNYRFIE